MRLVFGFRRYLLCVTLLLALPVAAKADFVITLTDVNTGTSETINGTNNSFSGSGPSTFINATPTSIVYFPLPTGFGNFSGVSVTISTNSPGSSAMGQVSETVNGTNTSGSADTLMLSVISTGFTAPGSSGSLVNLFNKLGNTAQGTASLTSSLVDGGGTVATTPTVTGSGTTSALNIIRPSVYTLTNSFMITLGGGQSASTSGTTSLTPAASVPEPANWALLGSALASMVFVGRRFIRREGAAA
jgi:hypothetical protein